MRIAYLATLIISLLSLEALAFEIEEQKTFEVVDPSVKLKVLSTADLGVFEPYITAFQDQYPRVTVDYTVASSTEVMRAIFDEGEPFDLVISSAMDLQTKLANDGFAVRYRSDQTARLPGWARWRDQVIAFTQEAAVILISKSALEGLTIPQSRGDLISLLRLHPELFRNRVGTYDIRTSGLGYLFATQDSRNSESFWSLTEIFGRLDAQLYCCSGAMIDDLESGRLVVAYNVLGSYAERRLRSDETIQIVRPSDFTNLMLRTALIPRNAEQPEAAGRMIDFLVSDDPALAANTELPKIRHESEEASAGVRPIRLGPELLVFLDRLRRQNFLENWSGSMEQLGGN
jgi:iron(III) transport system substrate-binding protein